MVPATTSNPRAWLFVLPVVILVAFNAIIPLMTVVNYSLQDIFGPGQAVFVGTEWFKEMLGNHRLHDALWRQFLFSGLVLLIEIPLGIIIALAMPKRGWGVSASLVTLALPLVIPWNVIGTIWIIFTRPDIGLFGVALNRLGIAFDHTGGDFRHGQLAFGNGAQQFRTLESQRRTGVQHDGQLTAGGLGYPVRMPVVVRVAMGYQNVGDAGPYRFRN